VRTQHFCGRILPGLLTYSVANCLLRSAKATLPIRRPLNLSPQAAEKQPASEPLFALAGLLHLQHKCMEHKEILLETCQTELQTTIATPTLSRSFSKTS